MLCAFSSWPATLSTSGALGGTHTMKKGPTHRTRPNPSGVVLLSYNRQAMHKSCASAVETIAGGAEGNAALIFSGVNLHNQCGALCFGPGG